MAYIVPSTSLQARRSGALGVYVLRRHPRRGLRGLGMVPRVNGAQNGGDQYVGDAPPRYPVRVCPAWGCGPAPIMGPIYTPLPVSQPVPLPPLASPVSSTAPGTFYAGTNVPVGTATTTPFVDPAGNVWVYNSGGGGGWVNTSAAGAGIPSTAATPPAVNVTTPAAPDPWATLLAYFTGNQVGAAIGLPNIPNFVFGLGTWLLVNKSGGRR